MILADALSRCVVLFKINLPSVHTVRAVSGCDDQQINLQSLVKWAASTRKSGKLVAQGGVKAAHKRIDLEESRPLTLEPVRGIQFRWLEARHFVTLVGRSWELSLRVVELRCNDCSPIF